MEIEHVPIAILGAGVAGLGAAYKANELGQRAIVFEARSTAGGLLDNFTIDGFRFDYGVHLSFATEELVRSIFDRTPYHTHPSDPFCFENDRWLKHPVQNNLFRLPAEERVTLIKSFLDRPTEIGGEDYECWLRHQYGDAISERYPIRYTKKYWDTPAHKLSTSWIGNRMRRAKIDEILFGALSEETLNHYYTKEMRYPKVGGYKGFIQPLIDATDIRYGNRCIKIYPARKELLFDNGLVIHYDQLVSTLPLPELASIADVPEEVAHSADKLKATSLDLISVGFKRPLVNNLWFYIYDEDILASRAHSPSVKSPENAPKNCSSLQFEFYSRGVDSKFDPEEIKRNTIMGLQKMGIAEAEDIVVLDHRRIKYGNVIFDRGMEEHRKHVLDWCEESSIATCGRFGRWDYFWSNQSFLSGYHALK